MVTKEALNNEKFVVAGRADGFGSRMSAFITAIYLAKKTSFKFGYVWCKLDGVVFMDDDTAIFEKEFCEKYNLNAILPTKGEGNTLCFGSINELKTNPKMPWGSWIMNYYILDKSHLSDLDESDYLREFGKIFRSLPFLPKYKNAILKAELAAKNLGDFVAIHLRAGDSIYDENYRRLVFSPVIMKYVFPVELAIFAAKKFLNEGKKVVLFSADKKAALAIREFLGDWSLAGNFRLATDFYDDFDEMGGTIFEITLMSLAATILAPHSTYSKFARAVGGCEILHINNYFSPKERFDAVMRYFGRLCYIHDIQKSASLAYAINLANALKLPANTRLDLCNRGLLVDFHNSMFRVMFIDTLFEDGQIFRAEMLLKIYFLERSEEFERSLLSVLWGEHIVFKACFKGYFKNANENTPYTCYFAAKIANFEKNYEKAAKFLKIAIRNEPKNENFRRFFNEIENSRNKGNSAVFRVKNHLSWKIGASLIKNYKTPKGRILLPFILLKIAKNHKPPTYLHKLDSLSDFDEALRVKNYFTYKLGAAFIKASKAWYKGCFVRFYFEAKRLEREFKNSKNSKKF